jgi:cyclopropane fatty-acyl-phospholipid synthase-like methyltransferase
MAARDNASLSNAEFRQGNGHDLSGFADRSVDFVFSLGVFERLPKRNVSAYLREIHRVLVPEGKAYLEFLSSPESRYVRSDGTVWDSSVYTFWDLEDIASEAKDAGLSVESIIQEEHVAAVVLTRVLSQPFPTSSSFSGSDAVD